MRFRMSLLLFRFQNKYYAKDCLRILILEQSRATMFLLECTILFVLKVYQEAINQLCYFCTCLYSQGTEKSIDQGIDPMQLKVASRIHVSITSPQLPLIVIHITKTINFQNSKAHLCTSKMFITKKSNFDLIQGELALLLAFDISVSEFYAIYQQN